MSSKNLRWRLAALLALTSLLAACALEATPAPPAASASTGQARVRREIAQVWAGSRDASVLPSLDDGEWHELANGSVISTDRAGEGWVRISDCLLVYVFQTSRLLKAACPKAAYQAGNVTCAAEGTSVFNNSCGGQVVVQADTAQIELHGTWIAVTYRPEQQRTVVIVLEGRVTARPVVNTDTAALGPGDEVGAGYFWFSNPGAQGDPVGSLAARQPHPLTELGSVAGLLGLEPWLARVKERAREDGLPFPEPSATAAPTEAPPPTTSPPTAETRPTPLPPPQCEVLSDQLNLRSGPGAEYTPPLARLRTGTLLAPLARSRGSDWLQVEVQASGRPGWVSNAPGYLDCNVDVARLPVGEAPPPPTLPPPTSPPPTSPPPTLPPPPEPSIQVRPPDGTTIQGCQCTTLAWQTENAEAVYLDGNPIRDQGERSVCLNDGQATGLKTGRQRQVTTSYLFLVSGLDGSSLEQSTSIRWIWPQVTFRASELELQPEQCTTLSWNAPGAESVQLDGEPVDPAGERRVCEAPHTYTLRVQMACGAQDYTLALERATSPNAIRNFRVSAVTDSEILVTVDYYYNGDHGDNVFVGAAALQDSRESRQFGFGPDRVQRGEGTATVRLTYLDQQAGNTVTTGQVKVYMYPGGGVPFAPEVFGYDKQWGAPTPELRLPTPQLQLPTPELRLPAPQLRSRAVPLDRLRLPDTPTPPPLPVVR